MGWTSKRRHLRLGIVGGVALVLGAVSMCRRPRSSAEHQAATDARIALRRGLARRAERPVLEPREPTPPPLVDGWFQRAEWVSADPPPPSVTRIQLAVVRPVRQWGDCIGEGDLRRAMPLSGLDQMRYPAATTGLGAIGQRLADGSHHQVLDDDTRRWLTSLGLRPGTLVPWLDGGLAAAALRWEHRWQLADLMSNDRDHVDHAALRGLAAPLLDDPDPWVAEEAETLYVTSYYGARGFDNPGMEAEDFDHVMHLLTQATWGSPSATTAAWFLLGHAGHLTPEQRARLRPVAEARYRVVPSLAWFMANAHAAHGEFDAAAIWMRRTERVWGQPWSERRRSLQRVGALPVTDFSGALTVAAHDCANALRHRNLGRVELEATIRPSSWTWAAGSTDLAAYEACVEAGASAAGFDRAPIDLTVGLSIRPGEDAVDCP